MQRLRRSVCTWYLVCTIGLKVDDGRKSRALLAMKTACAQGGGRNLLRRGHPLISTATRSDAPCGLYTRHIIPRAYINSIMCNNDKQLSYHSLKSLSPSISSPGRGQERPRKSRRAWPAFDQTRRAGGAGNQAGQIICNRRNAGTIVKPPC